MPITLISPPQAILSLPRTLAAEITPTQLGGYLVSQGYELLLTDARGFAVYDRPTGAPADTSGAVIVPSEHAIEIPTNPAHRDYPQRVCEALNDLRGPWPGLLHKINPCAFPVSRLLALMGLPEHQEPAFSVVLSPDEAPPGASDIEADLWWLHGRLPISISAHESDRLFLSTHSRYDHKSLMFSADGKTVTIKVMESPHKIEQRQLRAKWTPSGTHKAWVPFPDRQAPWDALYAFLRQHPTPRLRFGLPIGEPGDSARRDIDDVARLPEVLVNVDGQHAGEEGKPITPYDIDIDDDPDRALPMDTSWHAGRCNRVHLRHPGPVQTGDCEGADLTLATTPNH